MTEEERAELTAAKRGVTSRLLRADLGRYRLGETDSRLEDYCRMVIGNPRGHNLWEQLAVERFFRLIDRYGLDAKAVRKFYRFYEGLHFPGKKGLQRYALTPVQCFQFASVYGFRRKDGRRLTRECVLYVPRKFSKTTGSAAFVLWDLLFGDSNGEAYTGANSQDQAKKCFDVIRGALMRLDPEGKRFVVNEQMVKPTRNNPRKAIAQCLTANARTKDGLNASTIVMDEFSQARDAGLLTVLTTSMGVRDNPLTVIITTASDVFDGPFYAMLQGYKQLLLGKYDDDSVFAHLFEPDLDDDEDSVATWRKVHPHLGVTVSEDFYEQERQKAQRNGAEARLAFRTKLLNLYTENEQKAWISAKMAKEASGPIRIEDLPSGMPATIGIDLSVRDDFSAVTVGLYDEEAQHNYYLTSYFFPEGALAGHANERLYRGWAEAGHLILQRGEVIDYEGIVEHILGLRQYCDIQAIGYDPAKSLACVNMIGATEIGWALRAFRQTNFYFMSAVQSFEVGIRTGHITLGDNPITHYCFGNAVLLADSMGNLKPYKRTPEGKIDGVITTLMAHRMFGDVERIII